MKRRGFFGGLAAAIVAPFVVGARAKEDPDFCSSRQELDESWMESRMRITASDEIRKLSDAGQLRPGDTVTVTHKVEITE